MFQIKDWPLQMITYQLGRQPRIDSAAGSINERSGSRCIFLHVYRGLGV